tara:strand:- start:197 stop:544 length:348 start_codon:yes stop_codon:yes gene_type:complete
MAKKEHLRRQNVRNVQDAPFDQEEIALELHKEFNGLDRFDEDIPRANNVISVENLTDEEIKDREGKVDRNQFGTIELPAGSPRSLLDIKLTTDRIQLKSIRRVLDLEFEHFALKG